MRPRTLLALKTHLEKTDWTKLTTSPDYDTNVTHIHKTLTKALDHYVPEKTRHINYKALRREPWITSGILTSTRKAKKLFRQTQVKNYSQRVVDKYKNYNKMLQQIRCRAKKNHYLLMCAKFKNNTKKLWHTIDEISGKMSDKSGIIDYIKVGDITYHQPKQIGNNLGKYFGKVGQVFAGKIPKSTKSIYEYLEKIRVNRLSLFMAPSTIYDIKRLVDKLPSKSSSGHDNISNILLKEICEPILLALEYIVNESLKLGQFPTVMKLAEVVPDT